MRPLPLGLDESWVGFLHLQTPAECEWLSPAGARSLGTKMRQAKPALGCA